MLDIILVLLGMIVIGYAFYYNSRTLSEIKDDKIFSAWKLSIKVAAAFILSVFFVFSLVFFDFISLYSLGQDFPKIMLGFVFLASSLVVTLIVIINSASVRNIAQNSEKLKRKYEETSKTKESLEMKISEMQKMLEKAKSPKSGNDMERKIKELEGELEASKKIAKHTIDRELKMLELKKQIKDLKEQLEKKSR
jgi:hypothetical protein